MSKLPILEPVQDQALDIQHDTDPAQDHGPAKRIPNLGHAILFFSFAGFAVLSSLAIIWSAARIHTDEAVISHPGLALAGQATGYLLTLIAAASFFPRIWEKSFSRGIEWNLLAARRRWFWIIPAAVVVSVAAQYADRLAPMPQDSAILHLMSTMHGAWLVTAFGVVLAPLTEEIAFRGFLLPALATAYDWLALERTPAGLQRWQNSTAHSMFALIFGAVFSSIPFALLHAGQLAHAWAALGVLYVVSLVISAVRIRSHSVACSVLFHSAYNATIFAVVLFQTGFYRHLDRLNT